MKRILVPIGCRSDEGLSAPVIKRLREHFDVQTVRLVPQNFKISYGIIEAFLQGDDIPDLVFITGDRVEMCAAAAAAFHNKVKIAHFYAGVVNNPITTFDDIDRHCITLWSDIIFTEDETAFANAVRLVSPFKSVDIRTVGISHLDDLVVDESKVPGEPYDLVLYNDPPLSDERVIFEFSNDLRIKHLVMLSGNPDGAKIPEAMKGFDSTDYYDNLPRSQFLGLLKNCHRFITNSSAAIYEAPHFLKPEQIIMVGDRNRNRPRGPFRTGASDRIVAILREWLV